jgi:hypothetical protein
MMTGHLPSSGVPTSSNRAGTLALRDSLEVAKSEGRRGVLLWLGEELAKDWGKCIVNCCSRYRGVALADAKLMEVGDDIPCCV